MSEVAFHTKEEALAYADENNIALTRTRQAVYPDNHPTKAGQKYEVNDDNLEARGVVWVILDDNLKNPEPVAAPEPPNPNAAVSNNS